MSIIVERPIHPGDIQPGMRLRRRTIIHGIQRADELVCARTTDTHVINPRGYALPYAGADWYALVPRSDLDQLIDVLARALETGSEE